MDQTARQILSVIGTSSSCAIKKKTISTAVSFSVRGETTAFRKKWWINCWGYEHQKSTLGPLYGALITTMLGLSLAQLTMFKMSLILAANLLKVWIKR